MATFTIKSTLITNRDATPKVLTDAYLAKGKLKGEYGYITTGSTTDGVGSLYPMVSVPSNSRISALDLAADPLGTGAAVNIGVYWPTFIPAGSGLLQSNAGKQVGNTSNFFASALAVSNITPLTNVLNSSLLNTIANQELPLWAAIGMASDPLIDLDIVVSVQTVLALAGKIGLKVQYCEQ